MPGAIDLESIGVMQGRAVVGINVLQQVVDLTTMHADVLWALQSNWLL